MFIGDKINNLEDLGAVLECKKMLKVKKLTQHSDEFLTINILIPITPEPNVIGK